jgi:hypothetical protein
MSTLPCRSSCSFPPCERPIQVDGTKPFRSPTGESDPPRHLPPFIFISESKDASMDDRDHPLDDWHLCLMFNSAGGINERRSDSFRQRTDSRSFWRNWTMRWAGGDR